MNKTIHKNKNTTVVLNDNKIIKMCKKANPSEPEIQTIAYNLGIAPKVYDVFYSKNNYAMIIEMEYIKGHELGNYIKLPDVNRNALRKRIKTLIVKLYDNGIKHNDLTSKNIIITRDGDIKIIDYEYSELLKEPVPANQRDFTVLRNF
jgi:tRNA A-37 threonylcarbamoyl transferase component Bud32